MTDVDDDLQSFITDCEWKTRKILRESNKRRKDNARTAAAKERVEKLKHHGSNNYNAKHVGISSPITSKGSTTTPLAKSRSLNSNRLVQKSNPSTPKKITTNSSPGRDKIIHDAYETIKSFPVDKSSSSLKASIAAARKENQQTEKATNVHSSLSASPFIQQRSKGTPADAVIMKPKQQPPPRDGDNGEPAMITRRTIERDFYIMSKKRNNPSKRRQQSKVNEPTPELKTSVLRKKYRCDERIMKAKKKKAERLYEKFKRLTIPGDKGDKAISGGEDDDAHDSDSSVSSDEEEEYPHAIHDLLERHIADENARSLKRSNKLLSNITVKLDVKEFWDHLQQDGAVLSMKNDNDQSSSVPLSTEVEDAVLAENDNPISIEPQGPLTRYICPYKKPTNTDISGPSIEGGEQGELAAPLSMRITGCSPYSNIICPGHAEIGKRGVWRLAEPHVDVNPDPMFPIWPPSSDIKYPENLDISQASAFFQYKSLGPKKGDCITVLNSMAFESPVLAPYCYAVDKGYISPPFSDHEMVTGVIPRVHIPCTSLMEHPVKSRFDTLLPPPVVILDPGASYDDWKDAPRDANGNVYHCRGDEVNEFDSDGFRIKTSANRIEYDSTISSMVYGISESAASPNCPAISSVLTHTSDETCTRYLSRKRTAADYHYIAESDGEGTLNEPYLFATHMSAYNSVFVSRKSITSYREQEQFIHAAKEAERKKLDLALKMKAAEELVEERLKERIARIEESVKAQEGDVPDNTGDGSVAVEMMSLPSGDDDDVAHNEKIPCDVELPSTVPSSAVDDDEGNELEQLANSLLKNTNFLKAVARKLCISEEQILQIDSEDDDNVIDRDEHSHSLDEAPTKSALHDTPSSTIPTTAEPETQPKNMPKLKLNCKRYRDENHISSRGDGWKRLPRSETIIGDFSLTKRNVQSGTGQPKFKRLEDGRNFIAVNAVQEFKYKSDPKQFETEPKSLFIPDLTTERLRLATSYRQQKKAKESMLTMSQQQTLDEILQIPVSNTSEKIIEDNIINAADECDAGSFLEEEEAVRRPIDHVARAVLAVKNHNLPDLEQILDTEGLSVETRDQHGNTLFILACQQGSKKLAKFLLRRGANMNAQNNGGNTSLHYLYEYKHVGLAEYLIRKGANDSIKNGEGLTVYEGLCVS